MLIRIHTPAAIATHLMTFRAVEVSGCVPGVAGFFSPPSGCF